jgi:hypothetical protein
MIEKECDGVIRKFVLLFREHLDFLDEMGLKDDFNLWLDKRYRGPDELEKPPDRDRRRSEWGVARPASSASRWTALAKSSLSARIT